MAGQIQPPPSSEPPSFWQAALTLSVFQLGWLLLSVVIVGPFITDLETRLWVVAALQIVPVISGVIIIVRLGQRQADVLALQRELALHSQDRFYAVADIAGDVAYQGRITSDGDLAFDWAGDRFAALIGCTVDEVRERGGWRTVVHPDDWSTVQRRLPQLLSGKEASIEYRIRSAGGEIRWMHDRVRPLPDRSSGHDIIIYGALTDVTTAKLAEIDLQSQAAVLHSLFDTVPQMMGLVDVLETEVKLVSANAATLRQLSSAFSESLETAELEAAFERGLLHDWLPRFYECRRTARTLRFDYEWPTPHGVRWLLITLCPMAAEPGRPARATYAVDDVTDQRQAAEALSLSEQKFRTFVEQALDAIIVIDDVGRVIEWNAAAEQMTGLLRKQVFMQPAASVLLSIMPDDRKAQVADTLERTLLDALQTGRSPLFEQPVEVTYRHANGQLRVAQQVSFVIRSGLHPRLGLMVRDISARKQAEALMQLQRDLAIELSAITDQTVALQRILAAAVQVPGIDSGGIYIVDPESGAVDLVAHQGLPDWFTSAAAHYSADSANARLLMAGQPVYVNSTAFSLGQKALRDRAGIRALATIPVVFAGRAVAGLNLASHILDEIPTNVRVALESLAGQIGGPIARLQSDARLQASQKNLQSLFDAVDDFLFILDAAGRIVHTNPIVLSRLGYTLNELIGQPVTFVHPPDRREEAQRIVEDMLAERASMCPIPLHTKDGRLIPVETKVFRGHWDDRPVIFGLSRETTARNNYAHP